MPSNLEIFLDFFFEFFIKNINLKLPMTGGWGLRKFFHKKKFGFKLQFEIELKPMLGDLDLTKPRT